MADDTPELDAQHPSPALSQLGCAWFFGGTLLAGFLGMGLTVWAFQANAPGWIIPIAFFGPVVAFELTFGLGAITRFIRQARESVRNAPSPESAAAVAAGEGVEAGTTPKAIKSESRDGFPTVTVVEVRRGKVYPHSILRVGTPPGCQFGCIGGFTLLWNAILSPFLVAVIDDWNRGRPVQWMAALFIIPFVLVGLGLIGATIFAGLNWFVSMLVGRVEVEISDHPITPGATIRIHLAQVGLFPLARVSVWLVCTEEATYVAGTNTSTAKKEIAKQSVATPDESPTEGRLPLAAEFAVSRDAMHSFDAPNNKINWTVRVTGRVLGLLPFRNDFGVTVSPADIRANP